MINLSLPLGLGTVKVRDNISSDLLPTTEIASTENSSLIAVFKERTFCELLVVVITEVIIGVFEN